MCSKRNSVELPMAGRILRLDSCIREEIWNLNASIETVASCCGHGIYPQTILYKDGLGGIRDLLTDTIIPRTRNFYRSDSKGFYYIPEISTAKQEDSRA